jgi:predicted DNA-binding transcriptional regulator YafY
MNGTSGRLLTLLSLLQGRRDWPGGELADRLEVSGRTVRRDIERLRDLGYPVDALTGIEETAVRALVKLEQVLPHHLRRRVNALQSATATVAATGPMVDPEALTVIAAACRDRERLRFAYASRDGTPSRRHVEPLSLVNLGRRWYLVAWDCDRGDWRTFRIDRIDRPSPAATRFAPRTLPVPDAAAYVKQRLADAPQRYQARLTLHAPADAVRSPYLWGDLRVIDARRCEYRTNDDSLDWLAVRIGMLGVDFEVHEPPELVERFRELAGRFARAALKRT